MKAKLLIAALGGAIIGAALSRQFPLITVIVNVGNQGSIDIKFENGEPGVPVTKTLPGTSEEPSAPLLPPTSRSL
jgi:hypothetical protein